MGKGLCQRASTRTKDPNSQYVTLETAASSMELPIRRDQELQGW